MRYFLLPLLTLAFISATAHASGLGEQKTAGAMNEAKRYKVTIRTSGPTLVGKFNPETRKLSADWRGNSAKEWLAVKALKSAQPKDSHPMIPLVVDALLPTVRKSSRGHLEVSFEDSRRTFKVTQDGTFQTQRSDSKGQVRLHDILLGIEKADVLETERDAGHLRESAFGGKANKHSTLHVEPKGATAEFSVADGRTPELQVFDAGGYGLPFDGTLAYVAAALQHNLTKGRISGHTVRALVNSIVSARRESLSVQRDNETNFKRMKPGDWQLFGRPDFPYRLLDGRLKLHISASRHQPKEEWVEAGESEASDLVGLANHLPKNWQTVLNGTVEIAEDK